MADRAVATSRRHGNFLYTPIVKGHRSFHRVSYEKANIDVPCTGTGSEQRKGFLENLAEGQDIYDSLRENYQLRSTPERFIEERDEFSDLAKSLEKGFLPEEDREDLEELMEDEFTYFPPASSR